MTKSTGVGRGVGGGRPRKARVNVARIVPQALAAPKLPASERPKLLTLRRLTMAQMREMAADRAELAITTLEDVAENDDRGSARVAAAKELLTLAFGTPAKPAQSPMDPSQPRDTASATTTDFLLQ